MALQTPPRPARAPSIVTGFVEMHVWDQEPGSTLHAPVTRARIVNVLSGGLEGEGVLDCLFHEPAPGSGTFVGLERFCGRLGEREGTFVLRHAGSWDGPSTVGTWTIVPGSGTGDLEGIRGDGGYGRDADDVLAPYALEWSLGAAA